MTASEYRPPESVAKAGGEVASSSSAPSASPPSAAASAVRDIEATPAVDTAGMTCVGEFIVRWCNGLFAVVEVLVAAPGWCDAWTVNCVCLVRFLFLYLSVCPSLSV